MRFEITPLQRSSIWQLYRMSDRIDFDPEYQRLSDIWNIEKKALLIDTILNNFDVPKLYFHKHFVPVSRNGKIYEYAIIDGKQRLEAILSFIQGNINIADKFEYIADKDLDLSGLSYDELGRLHPDIKADFDGFRLDIVCIETDDIELIEEMFSRLNEAVPLSAAEKRNAFGGPIPAAVRKLSNKRFFKAKLPFENTRYRHYDLATKFLYFEEKKGITDTKKAYLDDFVYRYSKQSKDKMPKIFGSADKSCAELDRVFIDKDPLLRQVGMIAVYYLLFQFAARDGWSSEITRKSLIEFEDARKRNRSIAEDDIAKADYDLLEFDRFAQSPNDAVALAFRLEVLGEKAFNKQLDLYSRL